MPSKIVILNGPPGVGKDTLARFLRVKYNFSEHKFAEPLKRGAHALLGLPLAHNSFELTKDEKLKAFYGKKPRDFYIHVAENCMKECFGRQIFGHLLVRSVAPDFDKGINCVVSDSGFIDELIPVIEAFGGNNILVVTLSRIDCSFENDSRNYLSVEMLRNHQVQHFHMDLVRGAIGLGQMELAQTLKIRNVL